MNFFAKGKFGYKLGRVMDSRNKIMMQQLGQAHELFSLMPFYLGAFYEGLMKDGNTEEVFRAFADADESALDSINIMLVIWFIWTMDRFAGRKLINERSVREGLKTIWSADNHSVAAIIKDFDDDGPSYAALHLWSMVCEQLGRTDLSPVFVFVHLQNAQKSVLPKIN